MVENLANRDVRQASNHEVAAFGVMTCREDRGEDCRDTMGTCGQSDLKRCAHAMPHVSVSSVLLTENTRNEERKRAALAAKEERARVKKLQEHTQLQGW